MGIRMTAVRRPFVAPVTLVAVRDSGANHDGILVCFSMAASRSDRDDENGTNALPKSQTLAREQREARPGRSNDWEGRAAFGAVIVMSGLAMKLMSQCNDRRRLRHMNRPIANEGRSLRRGRSLEQNA